MVLSLVLVHDAVVQRTQHPSRIIDHRNEMAVEVRTRFDGTWCTGFELVEIVRAPHAIGYRVRRHGGPVLPGLFGADEVRATSLAAAVAISDVPVSFLE